MTIRFIKSWNGYYEGQIVTSPNGRSEADLVTLGYAVTDLDGPDNSPLPVTASKTLTGGIELTAGGESVEVGDFVLSTFPVGIAPSGTVSANGSLVLGTALNVIYSGGIYLQFPNGAVYAGSLGGAYYCVMSSTTAGVIYDNLLTGLPQMIASPVSIVAAGPGAYVTTTGVNLALLTAPEIAAGHFGLYGGFQATIIGTNNNSASGKTTRLVLNGVNVGGATTSTSTNNSQNIVFQNSGEADKNTVFYQNMGSSAYGQARTLTTVNTSAALTMAVVGNLVAATDWVIVDTLIGRKLGNV